jgi:hypothetical protein
VSYVLGTVVDFSDEPMVITVPKPSQDAIVFTQAESEAAFAKQPSKALPLLAGAGLLAWFLLG